jgi:MFS family permease
MINAALADVGKVPTHDKAELRQALVPKLVVATGFLVMAISFMVNAMDRQVFAPLLPTIRTEYGFTLPAGGLLATGFTLGMAFAGLPTGYLVDRFSRKTVLVVSIVIYSLGTLATPLASGWVDMSAYRILSGFGAVSPSAASPLPSGSGSSSARSSASTWRPFMTPGGRPLSFSVCVGSPSR